jgi:hypothetical protein
MHLQVVVEVRVPCLTAGLIDLAHPMLAVSAAAVLLVRGRRPRQPGKGESKESSGEAGAICPAALWCGVYLLFFIVCVCERVYLLFGVLSLLNQYKQPADLPVAVAVDKTCSNPKEFLRTSGAIR